MNKRTFIKKSIIGATSLALLPSFTPEKRLKPGIILNTLKDDIEKDYIETLEKLSALGYRYIESGPLGSNIANYASLLKQLSLKAISAGSSISNLEKDTAKFIKNAHALGQEYVVAYWPWRSSAENLTHDECMQTAEYLNTMGGILKKEGITFAWHNHDKEFRDIDEDRLPFDYLMQETDPALVKTQLDLYWVVKGGADPIELINKYPGRFPLFHVKDMDDSPDKDKACVGEGIINFKEIFRHSKKAGLKYPIVEQESNKRGFICAEVSYKNLIKWI
jgi:sugar phosphate isomerase/epimerase